VPVRDVLVVELSKGLKSQPAESMRERKKLQRARMIEQQNIREGIDVKNIL
jgi:hypothetical protein